MIVTGLASIFVGTLTGLNGLQIRRISTRQGRSPLNAQLLIGAIFVSVGLILLVVGLAQVVLR